MFQYAVGRALALMQENTLKLDVSGFTRDTHHQGFQLANIFKGTFEAATAMDVREILGWRSSPLPQYFFSKPVLSALRGTNYVVEPQFNYWPGIGQVGSSVYLSGYWQSERYFADFVPTIRHEFAFKPILTDQNAVLADQIRKCNAVSLHIRRGDYVSNPAAAALHGACSIEYYQAAVRRVASEAGPVVFYIFSDDPRWVHENFHIDAPCVYVDHNRGPFSYCDMELMSMCKHHIIANSSFSWWGAWLNPNNKKMVIAPQNWFAKPIPTPNLLPKQWIRL